MDDIVWSTLDAQRLQQLRREAGLSAADFAAMSLVTVAQIAQLEEGGDSLFYSARIKYSVGKRLSLQLIKLSQNNSETAAIDRAQTTYKDAHLSLLAIEEMSRRNLDASPLTDFYWKTRIEFVRFFQSKYVLASLGMLALMAVVTVLESPPPEGYEARVSAPASSTLAWAKSGIVPVFQSSDWVQIQWLSWMGSTGKMLAGLFVPKPFGGIDKDLNTRRPMAVMAPMPKNPGKPLPGMVASVLDNSPGQEGAAGGCHFKPLGGTEVFSTTTYRPATYVYLVAKKNTTVCIQDGQHLISEVKLALGASQSVHGAPPWHLRLEDLDAVDVFFQGHRVVLPPSDDPQFTLIQFAQDGHH